MVDLRVSSGTVRNRFISKWLLLCGIIAPPILAIFIISAAAITPDYSHISETVSQLGAHGRPYPEVMNAGFITYGLLIMGFAYGLYQVFEKSRNAKITWLMLTIYGAGIILSGIFQDDVKSLSSFTTLEGALHTVFAQVAFFCLVIGMWFFARTVHLDSSWRGFTQFSIAIAVFNLLSSLVFLMEFSQPIEGLLQRAFYMTSLTWIGMVAARSLRVLKQRASDR